MSRNMLVELHCHSKYSHDGKESVEKMLRYASKKLGAIAITDHNTGEGSKKAEKLAKIYDILVIPGIEIDCDDEKGQVLALGTNEAFSGNILEVIDKIHSVGGIAIAAHPFGGSGSPAFQNKEVIKNMDAIEAINGLAFSWQNEKARQFAETLEKPMISGSDAHTLKEIGKTACQINADNVDEILKAIKNNKVILPSEKTSALSIIKAKIKRRL